MYKEQSEYQRERFQQIYPRGCVAGGGNTGQRSSSAFRSSRGISRGVPRRSSTSMDIGEMNEEDSIPDIDDLTRENHQVSDDESMSAGDNDDFQSYSGSEIDTSQARNMQQCHHHQHRKYDPSHLRKGQHFQFPPDMY